MYELYVTAYTNKKQLQEAAAAVEHLISSKYTPAEEVKKRVVQAASLYEDLKNYDKALEYGNRAIKDGYGTMAVQVIVAQSYYLKNDFKTHQQICAWRGRQSDQGRRRCRAMRCCSWA